MMTQPLFTSELFARRALDLAPDERVVAWAEHMVLAGFDTPHLAVLLGEVAPFNAFEIDDMLERTGRELGVPRIASTRDAIEILATAAARWVAAGRLPRASAMSSLAQLYIRNRDASAIGDFYYLNCASDSLACAGFQYDWPDADVDNIDRIVDERLDAWRQEHPLAQWRPYEWHEIAR